jgi:acyl dehydratase
MNEARTGKAVPLELPAVTRELSQETIERYGHASGDLNPLHMQPAVAATSRFEGTIAHGMLVLAFISETMTKAFGLDWLRNGSLQVKMRNVARPGDTVTASGTLKSLNEREGYLQAAYAVEARNQHGDALISGDATVRIPNPNG